MIITLILFLTITFITVYYSHRGGRRIIPEWKCYRNKRGNTSNDFERINAVLGSTYPIKGIKFSHSFSVCMRLFFLYALINYANLLALGSRCDISKTIGQHNYLKIK